MDLEKAKSTARKHWLPLILATAGMIFFGYGLIQLFGSAGPSDDSVVFESSASSSAETKSTKIMVDVEGAVVTPGVYELPYSSRVEDAIKAAGGLGQTADQAWISKNVNLAGKLVDGGKLYIPSVGEATAVQGAQTSSIASLVNINSASSSQLEALPGIGVVTAGKIIDNRPYGTIEELKTRKVVSNSVFEKIKEKITVN